MVARHAYPERKRLLDSEDHLSSHNNCEQELNQLVITSRVMFAADSWTVMQNGVRNSESEELTASGQSLVVARNASHSYDAISS